MKNLTAFVVLFLMSCHPKTFVLEEKNDDKFFLNQEVKRGYSDGILFKNPLIIINGEVFKYDENLDTIKIPLKKSRIESVNLLNENGAKTIYGVEKRGAVIINAF